MRIFIIVSTLASILAAPAYAKDVYVQGHYRNNGSYVQPHYRTAPDNNYNNNYSSQGNVNPYTGQAGTVTYDQYQQRQYQQQQNSVRCDAFGNCR